jgi:hypothetical protein
MGPFSTELSGLVYRYLVYVRLLQRAARCSLRLSLVGQGRRTTKRPPSGDPVCRPSNQQVGNECQLQRHQNRFSWVKPAQRNELVDCVHDQPKYEDPRYRLEPAFQRLLGMPGMPLRCCFSARCGLSPQPARALPRVRIATGHDSAGSDGFNRCRSPGIRPYPPDAAELIILSASSIVKLFGCWTGGNSLKVAAHLSAIA